MSFTIIESFVVTGAIFLGWTYFIFVGWDSASKVQAEFRWWDEVDQFILLGAVPFRRDVPRLQKLGVYGVITLNEPFETLVPSSMYQSLMKGCWLTANSVMFNWKFLMTRNAPLLKFSVSWD